MPPSRSFARALALVLPVGLLLTTTTAAASTASASMTSRSSDVPHEGDTSTEPTLIRQLPIALHRRATDLLEERREADESPWVDGRLQPQITALYRPGEAEPAYIEFGVEGPGGEPRGFMVLSTGRHDHPVVELSMDGPRPSASLQQRAGDTKAGRTYRLGYSTYVLEDPRGRLLAEVGRLPAKVSGYDPAWREQPEVARAGRYEWAPRSGVSRQDPEVGQGVRFDPWPSWRALKREYADNHAPFLEMDRAVARDEWDAEDALAANGGTLQNREFREFPLLSGRGRAQVRLSGAGAAGVRSEVAERRFEGDMTLRVFVDDAPTDAVAPVDIHVSYDDGTVETLRLNVTERIPEGAFGGDERIGLGIHATTQQGLPTSLLGAAPKGRGRRVRAVDAPEIDCSKAVVTTKYGSPVRQIGDRLTTTGPWRTDDALVRIEHAPTGNVAFRSSDGLYWTATGGGGGSLRVSGTRRSVDQLFALFVNPRTPQYYGLQARDWRHYVDFGSDGRVDVETTYAHRSAFTIGYCQPRRLRTRWAGSGVKDVMTKLRKYAQIPAGEGPNTSQCASGCGATAWAMLFGFHDVEASQGVPTWASHTGLYRAHGKATGPDAVAPEWLYRRKNGKFYRGESMHQGAAAMIWEISQVMNDWVLAGCGPTGEKWTAPVLMGKAHIYLERRDVNAKLISAYDGAGIMTAEGKKNAYAVIRNGQPVVIGIGHLSHYPLAVGRDRAEYRVWDRGHKRWSPQADRRMFIVSMGWGRPNLELVPYDTWMAGSLSVASSSDPDVAVAEPSQEPEAPPSEPLPTVKPGTPINPQKKPTLPGPKPGPLY